MTAVIVATVFVVLAVYEWLAVRTRRVPTVTDLIKAAGWPTRIAVVVLGSAALFDHFLWDGGLI